MERPRSSQRSMFVLALLAGMGLARDACICGGARQRPGPPPEPESSSTTTAQPDSSAQPPP
ncbi:MAG: hypothetical protein IPM79_24760 [Polyangiaceae bacterium]|nr:hypothetical protein [Polyangiaceae bacterium]MBK8940738.1 hypothetical protein [Polyangiaceae bacterium]